MMIILLGVALTILCICSVAELAALFILILSLSRTKNPPTSTTTSSQPRSSDPPAPNASDEMLEKQRKRLIEENEAFQDLLNYNAGIAYGLNQTSEE